MASAGIPALVKTVLQKAKFKQLAMFSIKAITKAVAPGFRDWELNLQETVDSNGVEALLSVLAIHPGHPGIMREVMECLVMLLTDMREVKVAAAEAAKRVAVGHGVKLALDSMNKDKTYMMNEVGDKLFAFLKLECAHFPQAVLDGGGGAYCMEVMPSADPWACAEIFNTLENICGTDGAGATKLAADGVIQPSLDVLKKFFETPVAGTEPALEAGFQFWAKMCLNFDCHEQINAAAALDIILDIVDVKWENQTLLKLAGQIMSRLSSATGDDDGGPKKGAWSQEKKDQMEQSAILVAQMAAGRGQANVIMKGGGITSLVACLNKQSSAKTVEAGARAIAKLAAAHGGKYIKQIAKAKCLPPLLEQLSERFERIDGAAASITAALCAMSFEQSTLDKIIKAEAITSVVAIMKAHPYDLEMCRESLRFFEALAVMEYNMEDLVDNGAVGAVLGAMTEHTQHAGIQRDGSNALLYMATNEEAVEGMLEDGVLAPVLANLSAFEDNAEVHNTTLYFLASLALVDPALEALKEAGVVSAVSHSLRMHSSDREVAAAARDLVEVVVSPMEVQAYMESMKNMVDALKAGDGAETEEIAALAYALGALSVVSENLTIMMQANCIGMLGETLAALGEIPGSPELEEAMAACCYAMTELGQVGMSWDSGEIARIFTASGAVQAVVSSMKGHPTMTEYVVQAAGVLRTLASMPGLVEAVVSGGGIEACAYTMRANETSVKVVEACSLAMLEMSQSEAQAVYIATRGGTKQLLACLLDGAGRHQWAKTCEVIVNVLESVSIIAEGRDAIANQNGVHTVATAIEKFENFHDPASLQVVEACRHMLHSLVGSTVVSSNLKKVVKALPKYTAGINAGELDVAEVLDALDFCAALALAGVLVEQEPTTPTLVLELLAAAGELEDGDEDRVAIMAHGARALGQMGESLQPADAMQAVGLVMEVVRGDSEVNTNSIRDGVQSLRGLAVNSMAIEPLIEQGGVEALMDLMKQHSTDELMLTACFGAMATIARHEQGLAKLVTVGAVPAVSTWLKTIGPQAGSGAVAAALEFLIEVAGEGSVGADASRPRSGSVATLQQASVPETSTDILQAFCGSAGGGDAGDGEKHANPKILGSVSELFERMVRHDPNMASQLMEGQQISALLELLQADEGTEAYYADKSCMCSTLSLIRAVGSIPEQADALITQGGRDVVFAAMNRHPFNEELLALATDALCKLETASSEASPAEALEASLALFEQLATSVIGGAGDPDTLANIMAATQELSNRLIVKEAGISQERASGLMPLLENSLTAVMKVSAMPGEGREVAADALAPLVLCIGRLAAIEGITVEVADTVPKVVQTLNSVNPEVQCGAIFALGQFATNCTTPTVMALSSVGAIAKITRAMQSTRTRGNAELRRIATSSMEKIKKALQEHAGDLVNMEGGAEAVLSMLEASAYDAVSLAECVEAIFEENGGANALLEMMVFSDGENSFGVQAEVVKVLSQQSGRAGVEFKVANIKQISGVVRTLQQASKIHVSTEGMTQQQIADSKLVTASSLKILSDATGTEDQSVMLVEGGAIEGIVQVLYSSCEDEATVVECVNVLQKLAAHQSERVTSKLADGGVVQALLAVTYSQPDSQGLAESSIKLLQHMISGIGVERCQIKRDAMQMVIRLIQSHPDSTVVQEEGAVLLQAIQQGLGGDAQTLAVNYALESVAAAKVWQAVWDDANGAHYYYNNDTQGTQWDQPAEYTAMVESVAALESQVVFEGMDDPQIAGIFVEVMTDHGGANVEIVKTVVRGLSAMVLNVATSDSFCNAPGAIHSLVGIIDANNAEPSHHYDIVPACLALVGKLSEKKVFKDMASASGVITTVNQAILTNLHNEKSVELSINLLFNLCNKSKVNSEAIIETQFVHTLQSVMQSYPSAMELLSNCLKLLSQLMLSGGTDMKRQICEVLVCEVLEAIRRLPHEAEVLKMALRCIGNLATDDANIRTIVSQRATQSIVDSMAHQAADPTILQLAIEVIQNFSSLEEDDEEEEEEGSVYLTITEEQGPVGIIKAMKDNMQEAELLVAGLDALGNISVDGEAAGAIVEAGGCKLIVEIFQSHDWHQELIESAAKLLEHLTFAECPGGQESATETNCLPVLLMALREHARNGNFMQHAGGAIVNLGRDEENKEVIRNSGGIDTILGLMEKGSGGDEEDEEEFLNVALSVLTKLSVDDETSSLIATSGTHILAKVARDHFDNDQMLVMIFELIAQLAFIPDNVLCLVQYSGIELIFDAIEKHLNSEELMVKCIATIDHITMADEEYATIVCEAKGKEYVEEIMSQYSDNEKVQQVGHTALISISAMQNLAMKSSSGLSPEEEDELLAKAELTQDPLEDYRAMLMSGSVLQEWKSGKPASKHVLISTDMQAIILKDTKKSAKKGVMMPLKSVKMITQGLGKGHKSRLFGKKAKEDRAFNIVGLHEEVISLTCNLPGDCDRWVAALKALLDTYKNHRRWLVKK